MGKYIELKKILETARDQSKGKPIGNNTRLIPTDKGIGILFHRTVVVEILKNNKMILNNGGWYSVTTKSRMNEYLPSGYYIFQKKGNWFFQYPDGTKIEYYNGLKIDLKGNQKTIAE